MAKITDMLLSASNAPDSTAGDMGVFMKAATVGFRALVFCSRIRLHYRPVTRRLTTSSPMERENDYGFYGLLAESECGGRGDL